ISRFENILMNRTSEQTLYDFKMGLYERKAGASFDEALFSKCVKTLTAMANTQKGAIGYLIVGVCDKKSSAAAHSKFYGRHSVKFGSYYITGIDAEADKYEKDTDSYYTRLTHLIKSEPISDRDKDYIGRNIFTIKYHEKTVLIMSLGSGDEPSIYGEEYYVRHGSNVEKVKSKEHIDLLKRFS